jgi:hypothetical protein
MSTLAAPGREGPVPHATGNIGVGHQAPMAVSHSILTKDESLEQYATLKKDQTPPIMQTVT